MSQFDDILDLIAAKALGRLPSHQSAALDARIAGDARLAEAQQRLQQMVAVLRSDDSIAPPAELVARVKAMFHTTADEPGFSLTRVAEDLRQVIAALVFDSRSQAHAAGLRGAMSEVMLSFESPTADVDLEVTRSDGDNGDGEDGTFFVVGQINVQGEPVTRVVMTRLGDRRAVVVAAPDSHGMFRMEAPAGTYNLFLETASEVVVLPNVSIG